MPYIYAIRKMKTTKYPIVLSIAGSDSSGGAGIQADLKAASALGTYAATAITAVTVQNTLGVSEVHPVPPQVVVGQVQAVMDDLHPEALKTGMLYSKEIISALCDFLRSVPHLPPLVCDPVMVSTSGHKLLQDDAIQSMVKELFPLSSLITPNLPEAETVLGRSVQTPEEMEAAARKLLCCGCKAVLLKGGHLSGGRMADYLLTDAGESKWFEAERTKTSNTHGTGCSLSSAIAALLAQGFSTVEAVEKAKAYITQAIEAGAEVETGGGHGPVNHFFAPIPLIKRPINTP